MIIYSIFSIIFFSAISHLLTKRYYRNLIKNVYTEDGTGRFGLYEHPSLNARIEVEELQTAGDRTKIRILNSYIHTVGDKESVSKFLKPINNITWVTTSFISWHSNSTKMMRNKKIEELIKE